MKLPTPSVGLVISYAYLWQREAETGREEGSKNRPCAIIAAVETEWLGKRVVVLPITHAAPSDPLHALEIPAAVKRHLGLDDARSWVVVTEGNDFIWPGHDLAPIKRGADRTDYGFLPPRFMAEVKARFLANYEAQRDILVKRT